MIDRIAQAQQFRKAVQYFTATLPEEKALVVSSVFDAWAANVKYITGEWVSYGVNAVGDPQLYQVLQDHTSQEQYTPDTATSLYKAVGIDPSGIPTWVQPLGATDAYKLGDIVMHNDKKWKSVVDANVWEPGVYGWEEVTEDSGETDPVEPTEPTEPDEPDTPSEDAIPDFVQPTDATNAYNKGDKVKYNGRVYESLMDGNAYSPDAYPAGWKEITE